MPENALIPADSSAPRVPVTTGNAVRAFVPTDFDGAWRIAQMIALSGTAPKDLSRPEQVMVAILHGAEIGLPPMQAVQSIAVVNNRPVVWGDAALALCTASSVFEDVEESVEGTGAAMVARCRVTRKGRKPVERTFSMADARTAGLENKPGPWKAYPKRMLQLRARAFALRDAFPDVLRGLAIREEMEDVARGEAAVVPSAPPPPPASTPAPAPVIEGEFKPVVDAAPAAQPAPAAPVPSAAPPAPPADRDYEAELAALDEDLKAATDAEVAYEICNRHDEKLSNMPQAFADRAQAIIEARLEAIALAQDEADAATSAPAPPPAPPAPPPAAEAPAGPPPAPRAPDVLDAMRTGATITDGAAEVARLSLREVKTSTDYLHLAEAIAKVAEEDAGAARAAANWWRDTKRHRAELDVNISAGNRFRMRIQEAGEKHGLMSGGGR